MAKNNNNGNTNSQRPTCADMYERWILDCIIETAQAVAKDFVYRPRQYSDIPKSIGLILQDLWYRSGSDPDFPDMGKRQMICEPILGPQHAAGSPTGSQFHTSGTALRERARAFTERQVDTGIDNLRTAFRDEAITFRSYLNTLTDNVVVELGNTQTKSVFDKSVMVLQDAQVAGVFGAPPPTRDGWPLREVVDDDGARLIEEIHLALNLPINVVSQSQFVIMQRIANQGALTVSGVLQTNLNPDSLAEIDGLIRVAYSWKTALDAYMLSV